MKHEDWRLLVSAYCDGEVTPEERVQVEAHLAACAECAKALEAYRRMGRAIRALPGGMPSRTLWFRVQEGLARPARPLWRRLLPAASAVAVLLVAVVVGLLLRPAPFGPAAPQALEAEATLPAFLAPPIAPASLEAASVTPSPPPCPGSPSAPEIVAISARNETDLTSPYLRGLLYDEAGRPMPGATLVVSGTAGWQGSAVTASDGTFSLSLPAAGTYRLMLVLVPEVRAGIAQKEAEPRYRLILPDGSACQTWQVEPLPAFTIAPQQEISLTLRVRP